MVFNDTTNKNGLIQECEFWTGQGDGIISGDATLLKQFTSRINRAFDRIMPKLLSFSSVIRWDDTNNTDLPVATFNLVSGQADYTIAEDDNSLDILNITAVRILPSSAATQYMDVEIIDNDDPYAQRAMSPASTDVGTPICVLKRGNTLHFFPKPNYNATNGGQIFFEREQSYFASSDTTKEPGIPKPFHPLLALHASKDWLAVNKPDSVTLLAEVKAEIIKQEFDLRRIIKARYPARTTATSKYRNFR